MGAALGAEDTVASQILIFDLGLFPQVAAAVSHPHLPTGTGWSKPLDIRQP